MYYVAVYYAYNRTLVGSPYGRASTFCQHAASLRAVMIMDHDACNATQTVTVRRGVISLAGRANRAETFPFNDSTLFGAVVYVTRLSSLLVGMDNYYCSIQFSLFPGRFVITRRILLICPTSLRAPLMSF